MYVTVNGLNTFYTKEDGENAVLFLHGWGCDGSTLASLTQRSARPFLALDFWGFGKSDAPKENWGVKDYALQTEDFCIAAGLGKTDIVAHSFGARVAIVLASLFPQRVGKIVIIGGAGLRRFSLKRSVRVCVYKIKKLGVKLGIIRNAGSGSSDYQQARGVMRSVLVKTVQEDLSRYALKVKASVLLIYGEKDDSTPLWIMRRYNKLIKDSGCFVVKGGDHFCFVSHASCVALIINRFLGG